MNATAAFKAAQQTMTYMDADDFDAIIKQVYGRPYSIIGAAEEYNGTYRYVESYNCEQHYIDEALAKWAELDTPSDRYRNDRDYLPDPSILFCDMANKGLIPEHFEVSVHIYW